MDAINAGGTLFMEWSSALHFNKTSLFNSPSLPLLPIIAPWKKIISIPTYGPIFLSRS